jgi:hypothetical protein
MEMKQHFRKLFSKLCVLLLHSKVIVFSVEVLVNVKKKKKKMMIMMMICNNHQTHLEQAQDQGKEDELLEKREKEEFCLYHQLQRCLHQIEEVVEHRVIVLLHKQNVKLFY